MGQGVDPLSNCFLFKTVFYLKLLFGTVIKVRMKFDLKNKRQRNDALNTYQFEIKLNKKLIFFQSKKKICNYNKATYKYISSISVQIFTPLSASLNIKSCSWFFISSQQNRLRKQSRKNSDTIYTLYNNEQKIWFNMLTLFHINV